MLVCGSGVIGAGLLEQAESPLKAANISYAVFDRVVPNPSLATVDEGTELYQSKECDGLIALGGGSAMDTAKAIGVVAANGGSIRDYEWADPQPIERRIPPTICIPTTAGSGSKVTLWAVVTDPERKVKFKVKFNVGGAPLIAAWVELIDPELTFDLPADITAGLLGPVMEYNHLGEPQKIRPYRHGSGGGRPWTEASGGRPQFGGGDRELL